MSTTVRAVPADAPILVGVDGSRASVEALRRAAAIARATKRPLRIVSTWIYPATFPVAAAGRGTLDVDARHALDRTVREALHPEAATSVDGEVLEGNAADVLIGESRSAALLVVGSRGHGGFASLLLGSVSRACISRAHCPVLVVHGTARDEGKRTDTKQEAAASPDEPRPVVIGVDGSGAAVGVLRAGADMAAALGRPMRIVIAWSAPSGGYGLPEAGSPEDHAREAVDDAIAQAFGDTALATERGEVLEGHPAEVLIDEGRDAEMLVVGAHGHHGGGMLLGSVAASVAAHAGCPVLVVR